MSRRLRAVAFLMLAAMAAAGAAALADGYGASVADGYGPLRPVVVTTADLPAGQRIGPEEVGSALRARRVPTSFTPPDALSVPPEALGLETRAALPAGSYLLATQLGPPRRAGRARVAGLSGGRRPVEIAVSGAGALLAMGAGGGSRVDVVVTGEPGGSGRGRTYVAAAGVPLLGLRRATEEGTVADAVATLGLFRPQALRLIAAESFARKITLLPRG